MSSAVANRKRKADPTAIEEEKHPKQREFILEPFSEDDLKVRKFQQA